MPPAQPFAAPAPFRDGAQLAVVGDMRDEDAFMHVTNNDEVCKNVVDAIAADNPSLIAITGDLVVESSARDWARFDSLTAPFRAKNIPVVVAIGNHEYEGTPDAESQLAKRFPALQGHLWYTVPFGEVTLVFVDTTKSKLSSAEWAAQRAWYESALATADADPNVKGVLVLAHHPPITNSTVSGDEDWVKEAFMPAFLKSEKTLAYLGGHVHNYERFRREGKMIVVSGGGGAPPAKLSVGAARRHPDDLYDGPPLRPYHFVVYTLEPNGLRAEVRAVPDNGPRRVLETFTLQYPSASEPVPEPVRLPDPPVVKQPHDSPAPAQE